MIGMQLWLLEC